MVDVNLFSQEIKGLIKEQRQKLTSMERPGIHQRPARQTGKEKQKEKRDTECLQRLEKPERTKLHADCEGITSFQPDEAVYH